MLRIYSGKCRQSDVGVPAGFKDSGGHELFTGDIVMIWNQDAGGSYFPDYPTVVTSDQWLSFSDGSNQENSNPVPFIMGIKTVDIMNGDDGWNVMRIKSYTDVVDGEHWKEFGLSFKEEA